MLYDPALRCELHSMAVHNARCPLPYYRTQPCSTPLHSSHLTAQRPVCVRPNSPRVGHLIAGVYAEPKVCQLDLVACSQQDVLRLHVTMDHALHAPQHSPQQQREHVTSSQHTLPCSDVS